ncbi:MAG: hypothetical protein GXX10_06635 [Clostridiaceae bacterium]|nr:hypothetical protein [Clostridiaceae bacterium]
MNWWNELTGLQQIFATIAIPATLIMIVQFILLLFGLADDGPGDGADVGDISDGIDAADLDASCDGPEFIESADNVDFTECGDVNISTGADTSGHDADKTSHGTDALKLFTLRGIIGFFSIGGWFGVAAISWGLSEPAAVSIALLAGFLAMYFVAWSISLALRLQHSGTINLNNAVGNIGEVYIPIPPLKSGMGKVNVIVQERLCELSAVTDCERTLRTGEKVTVMGVEKEGVLLVTPVIPPKGD